jgi:hypothetical protein
MYIQVVLIHTSPFAFPDTPSSPFAQITGVIVIVGFFISPLTMVNAQRDINIVPQLPQVNRSIEVWCAEAWDGGSCCRELPTLLLGLSSFVLRNGYVDGSIPSIAQNK